MMSRCRISCSLPELSDLVERTENGISCASRAIRKQLKCGNVHQQKRALTVLEGLVEMGSKTFQRRFLGADAGRFADEKLTERIKYIAYSVTSDAGVRRKLMLILLSWRRHFMHDPSMVKVTSLYGQCGGIDHTALIRGTKEDDAAAAQHAQHHTTVPPQPVSKVRVWLTQDMTSVHGTIERAKAESNALLEAMIDAQARSTPILEDELVQALVSNVLVMQKEVVKYIHSVNDEEYLSMLVQTNDVIVDVLQRLQLASSGEPVQKHALGTEAPLREDIIDQAVNRLTVIVEQAHSEPEGLNTFPTLSSQVDASLVANSGFTSSAPSRAPREDYDTDSDADEMDMDVVAQNTRATQDTSSITADRMPFMGEAVQSDVKHSGAAPAIPNALPYK